MLGAGCAGCRCVLAGCLSVAGAARSAFAALSPEQINPKIKDMEYAVRGQLVINAMVRHALSTRAVVPDSRLLRCLRVLSSSDTCHVCPCWNRGT